MTLADFEEYFNIPAFSINADNLFLAQAHVRGNETEIFVSLVFVTDIDHFGRDGLSLLYEKNTVDREKSSSI